MSMDELRPIRRKLNQLPDLERAYVEVMILQLLEIENCGPISALDIIVVTSRFVINGGSNPNPKLTLSAPALPRKKRQNQK